MHSNGPCLDDEILADSEIQDAIKNEGKVHRKMKIVNTDRATLGRIGGAIAKVHGDSGFAGEISIDFEVGQSVCLLCGRSFWARCLCDVQPMGRMPDLAILGAPYGDKRSISLCWQYDCQFGQLVRHCVC